MSLLALGINHKTAPVEIRERVVFGPDHLQEALHGLTACPEVQEAAILSTCNRVELYCEVADANSAAVIDWLRRYHHLDAKQFDNYLYIHPDALAVRHMLRVASGLDSMVLGEPQILGQLKDAYAAASHAGTVGAMLNRLFQHTFAVAKHVRTDTAIGSSPVSVAFAAVSLAKQIFGDLAGNTALLIGAGETIELVARHLKENGIGHIIVANRTVERAQNLATQFKGVAIALPEIPEQLANADIVVSSTASPLPILGKGAVERAIKKRKHRPMFMVDIAVPRDIEPEVADLPDIYLYSVDDLQEVINENLQSRREAARQAEEIIDTQVEHFMAWIQSLDGVSTICAVREKAKCYQDGVLEKARRQLATGADPEQVLKAVARLLTNKLIHDPSVQIRQACAAGRSDLAKAARELFNVEDADR